MAEGLSKYLSESPLPLQKAEAPYRTILWHVRDGVRGRSISSAFSG
jgi:hypothetical protein